MTDQPRQHAAVALDRMDRIAELTAPTAGDAEVVELLLGQAPDADRRLLVGHPDLHRAAGGGDDVDHRADGGRRAGRVDADRGTVRAGPVADRRDDLVVAAPRERVGTHLPAQAEPALLEVDHEHLGPALAREQADALADRPGAEHDDALAGLEAEPG